MELNFKNAMKIYFLITLLTTAEYLSVAANKYCKSALCPAGARHIACKRQPGKFYASCPKNAAMVPIGKKLKSLIVNVHNKRRNYIAGGNVAKFRPACRMATMRWDPELAKMASYNVRQCKMTHDKCRNTARYNYSGQNLAMISYTETLDMKGLIKTSIDGWYEEYKKTKWKQLRSYPTNYKGPDIGHFTTMVGEQNIALGCAASTFTSNGVIHFLLACNYATTNIAKNPVYTGCARAASKCKAGRNPKYSNLCSRKERYNVNKW
ncbi:antigen 5 like allergen Cul n 1 [Musca domestica]|uniref:Antigen 5 like allergen Cul n 1 n=1 Tax=Musca domestica TaxID=7370 RepID=A0A9J7DG93_MUSDO|nr:antigen 5 like allergen Cul n 1 [Musca domestica]